MEIITSISIQLQFEKYPQHVRHLFYKTKKSESAKDVFRAIEDFVNAQRTAGVLPIRRADREEVHCIVVSVSSKEYRYNTSRKLEMRFCTFNDSLNDYARQIAAIVDEHECERVSYDVS